MGDEVPLFPSAKAAVSNSFTITPLPKLPRSPPRLAEGQSETCFAMLANFSPLFRRSRMAFASVSVFTSIWAQWILSGMDVGVERCVLYCLRDAFYISVVDDLSEQSGGCLGRPLLCRLGFHKWKNYGGEVQIFWQEPGLIYGLTTESKMVYEKRQCLRCGVKFKRIFSTNPDGTMSSVGWAPDTEGDQPKE